MPILMLTVKAEEFDKVLDLEMGAGQNAIGLVCQPLLFTIQCRN